jgi:ubiquinone/menaquinone biosynthesis C-methylase UbiE
MEERRGAYLDLSCGPGVFTRAMAAAAPGDWVVGVDISRAMLDTAAGRINGYANVALVRADAHDLPLASGAFAAVNNAGSLHVYDDPDAVFREIFRVLAKGGVFVGSTFAPSRSLAGRVAARLGGIRRFEPTELRAWLSRVGFADYDEIRLGGAFVFRVRRP